MVGLGRFELPTSRLSGVRSNQLSYRPISLCWRDFAAKKSHTSLGVRSVLTVDTPEGRVASVAITTACDLLLLIMKDLIANLRSEI